MSQEIYSVVLACFQLSFIKWTSEHTSHFRASLDFCLRWKMLANGTTGNCSDLRAASLTVVCSHFSDPDLNLECWNDTTLRSELGGCPFDSNILVKQQKKLPVLGFVCLFGCRSFC